MSNSPHVYTGWLLYNDAGQDTLIATGHDTGALQIATIIWNRCYLI